MAISLKTVGAAAGAWVWLSAALAGKAAVVNVTVGDDFFSPSSSSIHVGDSVVWKWDGSDHNVTSTSHPAAWKASATMTSTTATFTNTFTNAGTFPYECTIHVDEGMVASISVAAGAPANPPTVAITSPAVAALFAAPATVSVAATAADTGGTISGVQFLVDATPIGTSATSPFTAVATNLAAGSHTISAVATAGNGLKATNSVAIQVYTAVSVGTGTVVATPGSFQFSYSADVGARYVVQRSIDLVNWVSIATNSATANPEIFSDDNAPSDAGYYRVELQNP